ncbi:unnamed protein product, partial [Aureobasidium pullulans]
ILERSHFAIMKGAITFKGPTVKVIDAPIPRPQAGQVTIKVAYSGCNPKDWKLAEGMESTTTEINQGDDIAGTIHEVGEGVTDFKAGDRVIAFHQMMTTGGSYAEYAIAWAHTTARISEKVSFQEGAAVPLPALTSVVGLYARLNLPQPWLPRQNTEKPMPLLIYGASSTVGYYALQLAIRSNVHPIICIAGRSSAHVEKLLDRSKGDTVVDYRGDAVDKDVEAALGDNKLYHAYDCIANETSYNTIGKVMPPGGHIALVMQDMNGFKNIPAHVKHSTVMVGDVHDQLKDLGCVSLRYIAKGLEDGWFRAQPQVVVRDGLNGVQQALVDLKEGKASAVRYVVNIADTPGL